MFKLLVSCFLMFVVSLSLSATFCVDNSDDLKFVLTLSEGNNQDDSIKIEAGTYVTDNPNTDWAFEFVNMDNDHALTISGGWLSLFSNCDAQLNGNSQATVLDGENTVTPLFIHLDGSAANITIDNITFINGITDINGRGGGLNFQTTESYSGNITISRNQFVANQADYDSALSLGGGNRINVKNNLFVANDAVFGYTIGIVQGNISTGVYFTNNTVINNTGAGLRISVSGTPQAMVANNLFWNNDALDLQLAGSGVKYMYHNDISIYDGTADFELGNFSEEPEFDGGFLDFTPALSSSMINRGYMPFPFPLPPPFSRNWNLGTTDVLGKNRVQDNRVDIGAFEATAEVPIFADDFE